jgi:hypothetical protein
MKRLLFALTVLAIVTTVVAVSFAQQGPGGRQGQGRQPGGQPGQVPDMFSSTAISGEKIFILKDNVLYKVNAGTMAVEKKAKLDLPEADNQGGRMRMPRMNMTVEGKNIFLVGYNVIHKINAETLELGGTLEAGDLVPPEEKGDDSGGND